MADLMRRPHHENPGLGNASAMESTSVQNVHAVLDSSEVEWDSKQIIYSIL
jgi:hypothetical protein